MKSILPAAALLVLAACGNSSDEQASGSAAPYAPPIVAEQMDAAAPQMDMPVASGKAMASAAQHSTSPSPPPPPELPPPDLPEPGPDGAPAGPVLLAYSYGMTLEVDHDRVRPLATRHADACTAAGPQRCQILSQSINQFGAQQVQAYLSLRAQPQWLAQFRAAIAKDVDEADGRMLSQQTDAEDLTRSIVDEEARLRTLRALEERLLALLAKETDKVGELLQIERELARVRGEIDSRTSILAVMRARVDMSMLNLNYQSTPLAIDDRTGEPARNALLRFLDRAAESFGHMVDLLATLLPWLLLLGVPLWLLWRRWRRRRSPPDGSAS